MKALVGFADRAAFFFVLLAFFSITNARGDLQPPSEFTVAVTGADITIRFGTVPGQTYAVEKSTTLAQGSWTEILGNVAGTGVVKTTTDAGAASLRKCFYRIRYRVEPMYVRTQHGSGGQNGLFAAVSTDGKTFQPVSNQWPSPYPYYVRDPSIIKYGNAWVTVYTNAFSGTGSFGIATSTDLVNWTKIGDINIPGVPGPANNTWAPEWLVDGGTYYVVVRYSQTGGTYVLSPFYSAPGVGYMQCTNPGTWTAWTNWIALGGIPTKFNDAYIAKAGSTYRIFGRNDDSGVYLETASSSSPFSGYTLSHIAESAAWASAISATYLEGPCAVNIGGSHWLLYFQKGDDDTCYYVESADDMATWGTVPTLLAGSVPTGANGFGHGTVLAITKNDYATAGQ